MKKLIITLIGISLLLSGCSVPTAQAYQSKQVWFTDVTQANTDSIPFQVFPVKIKIDGLTSSWLVDTWPIPGNPIYPHPDYKWKEGEPMAIAIHNKHDIGTTFKLTYFATSENKTDGDTGIIYEPTPLESSQWIIMSTNEVTIPANTIAHIPIAILTPKKLPQVPDRWEFDVQIDDESLTGMVITNTDVRFLISMGK
jgi:hypothetical protein